jgi:hypothetical protein
VAPCVMWCMWCGMLCEEERRLHVLQQHGIQCQVVGHRVLVLSLQKWVAAPWHSASPMVGILLNVLAAEARVHA